jgi:abortive infection bacteriophage resistance protein
MYAVSDIRIFPAKFDSKCSECEQPITQGTKIKYHVKLRKAKHIECPNVSIIETEDVYKFDKTMRPTGLDMYKLINTFKDVKMALDGSGIDVLEYSDDELLKLINIYRNYLTAEEAPF